MQSLTALTRCFVVSDRHRGALYSDSKDGDDVTEEGLRGYWVEDPDRGKVFIEHPAEYCVDLGDNDELINLPLKGQPETVLKYSRHIDGHIDRKRESIEGHPDCKFIIFPANHERIPEYDVALDQLKKEILKKMGPGHMEIQRHFKRIADGIFLHGDQPENPWKYHVDEDNPHDYSGKDGRYKESYKELYRPSWLQALHDIGNRYLPWPIGRTIHSSEVCIERILAWFRDYERRHVDQFPLLEGINHFFSAHTHDPYTGLPYTELNTRDLYAGLPCIDPQTIDWEMLEQKTLFFHNTGASIFQMGRRFNDGTQRINRHCFNAQSVFVDSDDIEDPAAKIVRVISHKWPRFHWPPDPEDRKPPIGPVRVPEQGRAEEEEREEELQPVFMRAGSYDPARRTGLVGDALSRLRRSIKLGQMPERTFDL